MLIPLHALEFEADSELAEIDLIELQGAGIGVIARHVGDGELASAGIHTGLVQILLCLIHIKVILEDVVAVSPESSRDGTDRLCRVAVHDRVDSLLIREGISQRATEVRVVPRFDLRVDEHDDIVEGLGFDDVDLVRLCFKGLLVSRGELASDLRLAGLQHLAAGAGFRDLADINIRILSLGPAAAIALIGFQNHTITVGLGNGVRTATAVHAPLVEVFHILVEHAVGHDIGGIRRGGDEVHRAGISAGDRDLIVSGRFDRTAVLLEHRVPNIDAALAEIHRPLEGIHHLLGGEFAAIMEGYVVTDLKDPYRSVFVGFPGGGKHGYDLSALRVVMRQRLIDVLQDHDTVGILDAGIQRHIGDRSMDMIQDFVVRSKGAAAEAGQQAEHKDQGKPKGQDLLHNHPSFCSFMALLYYFTLLHRERQLDKLTITPQTSPILTPHFAHIPGFSSYFLAYLD